MIDREYSFQVNRFNHDSITLIGVDSGPLNVFYDLGNVQIWKNSCHTVWVGRFMAQKIVPTSYWLVKIAGKQKGFKRVEIIKEYEFGKRWRKCLKKLFKEAEKLSKELK